jgi:AraC-like DNA-binding protein
MDDVPESVTSFFTEPADFAAALANNGGGSLVITGRGRFRAQLTRIALDHLRLLSGEESLSRIAFIAVPDHMILIALQSGNRTAPVWGGIMIQADEIITFGPGSCAHMRTNGSCKWAIILAPVRHLARYGYEMIGETFCVPNGIRQWRPPRAASRPLRGLYAAAIRAVEGGHPQLIGREAAHGLDQQITGALVECLSAGSILVETLAMRRYQEIMARVEALLEKPDHDNVSIAAMSAALGVSPRVLHRACQLHLGINPAVYLRLRGTRRPRRKMI